MTEAGSPPAAALADRGDETASRSPVTGRPGLSRIARGSILNLLGAAVSSVVGVVLLVVITRSMPQSTAGFFFTLTSLFLLAEAVACLGTGTGLVYFTARVRSLGQPERIRAFQRIALTPALGLSVLATAVLVIWAPEFARLAGGGPGARDAVIVLAVLMPLAVLSDTVLAGTRGHATMLPTVLVERIGRPLVQLGLVALAVGGGALWLVAGAWALPWLASSLLALWWLNRLGHRLPATRTEPVSGALWREFWTFTWPRALNSVVQLALQRMDIVLITVLIGPAHAAVYTAATRFLIVGQLSNTSVANAAQPRLAEVMAVQDTASAKAIYQSATAWVVLLTWPLYLLCAVFAGPVLKIFGSGYTAGVAVVEVLAGAMLLATACGMVDMLLNMAGRTTWTLANSVTALGVMLLADLLLIPRLGILGAAIGWAAAIAANNCLPLAQLFIAFRMHPFGRATLSAAALAVTCLLAVPVAARLLAPGDALVQAAAVVVGGSVFVAVCLRWRAALGLPGLAVLRRRQPAASSPAAQIVAGEESTV